MSEQHQNAGETDSIPDEDRLSDLDDMDLVERDGSPGEVAYNSLPDPRSDLPFTLRRSQDTMAERTAPSQINDVATYRSQVLDLQTMIEARDQVDSEIRTLEGMIARQVLTESEIHVLESILARMALVKEGFQRQIDAAQNEVPFY